MTSGTKGREWEARSGQCDYFHYAIAVHHQRANVAAFSQTHLCLIFGSIHLNLKLTFFKLR